MQKITVRDSVELAFETFGDRQRPLVLLIPGAGAPAAFWPEVFCESLAKKDRHVVRYCHRDTGYSTHFDVPYAIDELLLDMVGLLDGLGSTMAHLIGHSMGGFLAQMAACRLGDAVASITSISAGSTVSPDVAAELGMSTVADETWQVLMKNQPSGNFDRDLPGWLDSFRFLNGKRPFDEAAATRYIRSLYVGDPRNAQVATNHIHAMSTVPDSLVEELTRVRCPVLVIHGTEDPLVPLDHGEATARLAPDAEMIRLQGAGHMFFNDDIWQEILRAVEAHLA